MRSFIGVFIILVALSVALGGKTKKRFGKKEKVVASGRRRTTQAAASLAAVLKAHQERPLEEWMGMSAESVQLIANQLGIAFDAQPSLPEAVFNHYQSTIDVVRSGQRATSWESSDDDNSILSAPASFARPRRRSTHSVAAATGMIAEYPVHP